MRGRVRGSGIVAVAALLASCGPPPVAPQPDGGAGPSPADAEPSAADANAPLETAPAPDAPPASPADELFRQVLGALASGSARAVRALVPSGGLLVLTSHVCRRQVSGASDCRDERVEAERRRITDEVLGALQDLFRRAAAADAAFSADALDFGCAVDGTGLRWTCTTRVPLGRDDACRGDFAAPLRAVVLDGRESWSLVELSFEEEILDCD